MGKSSLVLVVALMGKPAGPVQQSEGSCTAENVGYKRRMDSEGPPWCPPSSAKALVVGLLLGLQAVSTVP